MIQYDTILTSDLESLFNCNPILLESDFESLTTRFQIPNRLSLVRGKLQNHTLTNGNKEKREREREIERERDRER